MKMLRRAFTGAVATAVVAGGLLVAGATPAAAASEACVFSESTRLLTANDGEYKLWIDTIPWTTTVDQYHICFALGSVARGALVIREPLSGSLTPTVAPDLDDDNCPRLFELQDPVALMTRLGQAILGNPGYFCFGVADQAYRITFAAPSPVLSPNVELFIDRFTELWYAYCAAFPNASGCIWGEDIRVNIV